MEEKIKTKRECRPATYAAGDSHTIHTEQVAVAFLSDAAIKIIPDSVFATAWIPQLFRQTWDSCLEQLLVRVSLSLSESSLCIYMGIRYLARTSLH